MRGFFVFSAGFADCKTAWYDEIDYTMRKMESGNEAEGIRE